MAKQKQKKKSEHPWRENIELITMAILMAVFFKYFVVEAYRIPSGSMQPTLMGNEETALFDRILVDKLSFHFRDPERFEIVVFKHPHEQSKNVIKRICGMPGEQLEIRNGDLFVSEDGSDWAPLRRPKTIYDVTLKELDTAGEWHIGGKSRWTAEGDALQADGPGYARYPSGNGSIMDRYADGYPGLTKDRVRSRSGASGENPVGDLRVECSAKLAADCSELRIDLREGSRTYRFKVPGPAASETARPAIEIDDAAQRSELGGTTEADEPWRMRSGRATDVAVHNLDDLLVLEIDGERLIELEVPEAADQRSSVTFVTEGGGGSIDEIRVLRDIYYLADRAVTSRFVIPEGHYVMLGDNTQDSADGRSWQRASYAVGDEIIYGNWFGTENPRVVTGGEHGTEIFFRDEFGERRHFLAADAERRPPERAPLVPRELIRGRGLAVFWPISLKQQVARLKWIQ